jgi:hypothetical protein
VSRTRGKENDASQVPTPGEHRSQNVNGFQSHGVIIDESFVRNRSRASAPQAFQPLL